MEIMMGLPIRRILTNTKHGGAQVEIIISTEAVNELITKYLDAHQGLEVFQDDVEAFEYFDDQVMYYVPDGVFLGDVKQLVDFLNAMDDQGYK